ncbi:hypothetical protein HMPREF9069_01532 [Atopobium sp. oral taxon 810 str. F0209]|nr:hypothetical protein HMPREF9069_01532 [Atopobium sp. oral taxon 810 str. F0209]
MVIAPGVQIVRAAARPPQMVQPSAQPPQMVQTSAQPPQMVQASVLTTTNAQVIFFASPKDEPSVEADFVEANSVEANLYKRI